jgi:hypothetical protein
MFAEMNHLLAQQGREELAREVRAGRLGRALRAGRRHRREGRSSFGLSRGIGAHQGARAG